MLSILTALALSPALAFEPPPFDPDTRLHKEGEPSVTLPRSYETLREDVQLRIFAVVTARATDARHGDLGWGSEAEAALERTWESWSTDPRFDPATDTIVFVALAERETRIRAGSVWDAEYGLHNDALTAITERHFVPKARAGDIDGALAETLRATDQRFRSLRDLPEVLPQPTLEGLTIWPDDVLLPRVARGRSELELDKIEGARVHVAQNLPSDADPDALAEELLGDDPEGLAIVWDVKGDRVEVALSEAWQGLDMSRTDLEELLLERGRDDEGHLTSQHLGKALFAATTRMRKDKAKREFEARRAWSFAGDDSSDGLSLSPPTMDLPQTRALIDSLAWPVRVAAVDRADTQGEAIAPGGQAWLELVRVDASRHDRAWKQLDGRETVRIIAIDTPRVVQVRVPSALRVEGTDEPVYAAMDLTRLVASDELDLDTQIAESLRSMDALVQSEIAEREAEALARRRQDQAILGGGVAVLAAVPVGFGGFALLGWRRRRKLHFLLEHSELTEKVQAARGRLDDFRLDAETRELVNALKDRGPETSAVYAAVTEALDEVELGLRALEGRLQELEPEVAAAPRAPDPRVWDQLTERLLAPLRIEPAAADDSLFAPVDQSREIDVHHFMRNLAAAFEVARERWDVLMDAARARLRRLDDDLDRIGMNEVADRIAEAGLAPDWMNGHPYRVHADDLPTLDAMRGQDPVAYVREMADLNDRAADAEAMLMRLAAETEERASAREQALRVTAAATGPTVLLPEHDPAVATEQARAADAAADAHLRACDDPIAAIEHLDEAQAAWEEVSRRRAVVETALTEADPLVRQARTRVEQADEAMSSHLDRLDTLARSHGNLEPLRAHAADAQTDLREAKEALGEALTALSQQRHVEAWYAAKRADQEVDEQTEDLTELMADIEHREQARDEARQLLARLDRIRGEQQSELDLVGYDYRQEALYDGDRKRSELDAALDDDRPDWLTVLSLATATRTAWTRGVASARSRERAARAAAAAIAAAAARRAAARTRSSYSSSSSSWSSGSSSSSWSSGSSSGWSSSSSSGSSWSSSSRSGGSSFGSSGRSGGSSWSSSSGSSGRSGGSSW